MSRHKGKIWLDGKLVESEQACVHLLTHALHYGTGVFEGVRAYKTADGPAIFRLVDHTSRLLDSAKAIGIKLPYSHEQLCDAQVEVVAVNGHDNAYIRPLAFYDDTALGLSVADHGVRISIATMEWGAYLGDDGLENGIHVGISSIRRPDPDCMLCNVKVCGNYVNSVRAKQEALANGYAEALMLDMEGFLSEGSGENIFLVRDGRLLTPPCTSALDGITRRTVIELAKETGIDVSVEKLAKGDVFEASEAFFTGTAAEVTPISTVDGKKLGDGKRGPVTKALQEAYFACVKGENERRLDWLTHVDVARRKAA